MIYRKGDYSEDLNGFESVGLERQGFNKVASEDQKTSNRKNTLWERVSKK
jgi:hypothetical protein